MDNSLRHNEANKVDALEEKEHTNIKLIYEYTEYRLKLVNDSINALNTKLSAILGFSATSIVFSINLPNQAFITNPAENSLCYCCLLLKIIVCVLLVATIYIGINGFRPKAGGGMTPPSLLLEENYYDSDEDCRLIITKTWIEALKELESIRDEKAKFVEKAVSTLCGAALVASFSVILAAALPML